MIAKPALVLVWLSALLTACGVDSPVPVRAVQPPATEASPAPEPEAVPPATTTTPAAEPVPVPAQAAAIMPPVVEMVRIAAGAHRRSEHNFDQSAAHVELAAFEIDREPVSRAHYAACIAAGACPELHAPDCVRPEPPDAPMHCIDWFEAQAYCAWVGKELANEDEWERARPSVVRGNAEHFEWALAQSCWSKTDECRGRSDWAIDGWREESIFAAARGESSMPLPEPHERAAGLGARCIRRSPRPAPTYAGPCWSTCDGCKDLLDGKPDDRHVARWDKDDRIAALVIVDAQGKRRGKAPAGEQPSALVAAAAADTLVRDPSGRVVSFMRAGEGGTTSRELLHYDAAGNVRTRVSVGAKGRRHWTYHYGCWAPDAARPHPDATRCPRTGPAGRVEPQTEFGRCVTGPGGRWELALDDVKISCEREAGVDMPCFSSIVSGTWTVVYVPKKGTAVSGPTEPFVLDEISLLERRPLTSFDFDGDGHAELALRRSEGAHEDLDPTTEVWTYATTVHPYAPAAAIADVDAVADIDGDGRPDLRIDGKLSIAADGTMGDNCTGGVSSVARSRPDGTFAIDERETRADLLVQCPKPPTGKLFDADDANGEALSRIACAYLWGEPKLELRGRVLAEWDAHVCNTGNLGCGCDRDTVTGFVDGLPPLARRLGEP